MFSYTEPLVLQKNDETISIDTAVESEENGRLHEHQNKSPSARSGVLERYRHLSERSWSSTSSGEISIFDDTRGRQECSPYNQESPVSWMPACLSLSRRGVSLQLFISHLLSNFMLLNDC